MKTSRIKIFKRNYYPKEDIISVPIEKDVIYKSLDDYCNNYSNIKNLEKAIDLLLSFTEINLLISYPINKKSEQIKIENIMQNLYSCYKKELAKSGKREYSKLTIYKRLQIKERWYRFEYSVYQDRWDSTINNISPEISIFIERTDKKPMWNNKVQGSKIGGIKIINDINQKRYKIEYLRKPSTKDFMMYIIEWFQRCSDKNLKELWRNKK